MPIPIVKQYAEQTGKSIKEVEELWKKSLGIAYDELDFGKGDFNPYAVGVLKNMLGINESSMLADEWVNKVMAKTKESAAIIKKKKVTLNHVLDIPNLWILNVGKAPVSQAVNMIAYHNKSKSLFIDFNNRNMPENWYHYKNVPLRVFQKLTEAPSKGRFIAEEIKGHYETERV